MPRNISDRRFLETRVQNKKVELGALTNAQATSNAVYDNAKAMLIAEIDAIEEQLNNGVDETPNEKVEIKMEHTEPERDKRGRLVVHP